MLAKQTVDPEIELLIRTSVRFIRFLANWLQKRYNLDI